MSQDRRATPRDPNAVDAAAVDPLGHFAAMIDHCHDYAAAAHAEGRPIVGIMCEYTPREMILAAGAVPVCLCGGSAETIPAAEQFLPVNLCPLIKSTYGYLVKGSNPFLEWADLVVAETTCDGKKKMFELMGAAKPMFVLALPHKAGEADAFEHWVQELEKFRHFLEARYAVAITDARLREAIALMNRERHLRRELAARMERDRPPLTGRQLLDFRSIISGQESDLRNYEAALRLCDAGLLTSASTADRVRVLLTGVPIVHGAERVLELIEQCGAVVVAMENCSGLKPILEDVDADDPEPLRALARKYFHLPCSVMTPNDARLQSLRTLASRFRPDCVIELIWQACLTYDVESLRVRRLVEDELRLPYLKLTTDYSPADSGRIVSRVEALCETVRSRLAARSLQ